MNRTYKLCSLFLVLVLALSIFCACGTADGESNTSSSSAGSDAVSSEESRIVPEVIDLGGREINVFCWDWSSASILGYTGEILYSTENNESKVDVAKKKVIDDVQATYNCKIDGKLENSAMWAETVRTMVMSGTYTYDILFNSSSFLSTLVASDLLADLNSISTIHLENPWWDQNAVKDLSIGNHLYYVCGDINTYDDLGTWCVLFNKTLKQSLGIEQDFYRMVKDGSWTFDNFIELCKGVTINLNGGNDIDEFDRWAFGTELFNIFAQVVGGGLHIVQKDENDLPTLMVETQRDATYNALDKIISFYNSGEVMVANGGKFPQYGNLPWEPTVHKAFIEGRELFYMCGLIHAASFRSMDDDFGILPIPKTFANQDTYYHTVSPGNSSYMAIPYGVPNIEELGVVIEAIAMKSREYVTPEFYESQLKYRDTRDNESAEMLDLIFSTRSFDLGPVYNWGNILNCYTTLDSNYASKFDSILDAAKEKMTETIELVQTFS